jgi:hypothetical protein
MEGCEMIPLEKAKESAKEKIGFKQFASQVERHLDTNISADTKAGVTKIVSYFADKRDCELVAGNKEVAIQIIQSVGKKYEEAGYKVSYHEELPAKRSYGCWVYVVTLDCS